MTAAVPSLSVVREPASRAVWISRPAVTTTTDLRPYRSVYEWWSRKVLNLAEMNDFCQSLGSPLVLEYETAHGAKVFTIGPPKSANLFISALLVARRGQCRYCGPLSQAPAMACDLELT